MKKNIAGLFIMFLMGLFASCGDDDNQGTASDRICISAQVPVEFTATRGVPAGHKLRCILELWDKNGGTEPVLREEVSAESLSGGVQFDFNVRAGAYDCLMWADYVDAGTGASSDKYFVTSDLANITVKDARSLINNDACDAFFYRGEIQKGSEALQQEIELARPFAKVSIKEKKVKELSKLKKLTVGYSTPVTFNVKTGKVIGENVAVDYTNAEFDATAATDGTLFTAYVFADEESPEFGNISLNFVTETEAYNATVPRIIPLQPGQHIQVSGHMMTATPDVGDFEIAFDMEMTDWEDSNQTIVAVETRAKVGDFFYADGSYSSMYIKDAKNPCIGVVFAVAHDGGKASGDVAANYVANDGTRKLEEVQGWVVAVHETAGLLQVKPNPAGVTGDGVLDMSSLPASALGQGKTDIKGFLNTEVFKKNEITLSGYPVAEAIVNYENAEATKAPANTSGWYWGAINQYAILAAEYASVEGNKTDGVTSWEYNIVGKSLKLLADEGAGALFGGDGQAFYWSSSVDKATGKIFRAAISVEAYNHGATAGWKVNDSRHVRAILTF